MACVTQEHGMSVERVQRKGELVWRTRWREGATARSRVFRTRKEAVAFDAEIRRLKRGGGDAVLIQV